MKQFNTVVYLIAAMLRKMEYDERYRLAEKDMIGEPDDSKFAPI